MNKQLVVNGCSYMHTYVEGNGHVDLANHLGISAHSLTISGSANSRILRTALKHSFQTPSTCLYILGLTFISREELPICRYDDGIYPTEQEVWEGAWTNPQNQLFGKNRWIEGWKDQDTKQWVLFREKYEKQSLVDRLENLMYNMLSTIHSLESRGHQVVMYQQADEWWHGMSQQDLARLTLLDEHKNIVDGFRWCAVREQHRAGVLHLPNEEHVEPELRHRLTGEHGWLNNYLETYIRKHELHL
jgi:hypothetical protein